MTEETQEPNGVVIRRKDSLEEVKVAGNENGTESTENRCDDNVRGLTPTELCEELSIAQCIFNHLQIFQYLEDLENHDKRLMSNYLPLSVTLNKELRITFLKDWRKNWGWGKRNIEDWNLEGDAMSKESFIENFVGSVIAEHNNQSGERSIGGLIQSMLVM